MQQRQSGQQQQKEKQLKAALDKGGSADSQGKWKSDRWKARACFLEQHKTLAELSFKLTGNIKLAMLFHGQQHACPPNDIDREYHYEVWLDSNDFNVKVRWEIIILVCIGDFCIL